eukprot:5690976-Pyramimonas_sp.AAC.1
MSLRSQSLKNVPGEHTGAERGSRRTTCRWHNFSEGGRYFIVTSCGPFAAAPWCPAASPTKQRRVFEWGPRDYSGLADEAASKALDMGQDWFVQRAENMQRASEAADVNYIFSIDGAK